MKTIYGAILVLATATAILLTTPLPCRAVEQDESLWFEEGREFGHKQFKLTDEKIERIMHRLSKTDPKRAEELEELREKEPQKFRVEIRKFVHEEFRKRAREHIDRGDKQRFEGHGKRGRRKLMRERHREYLRWLRENYPEKAKELGQIKERDSELYRRQLGQSIKKYGRIQEAMEENPQLAEVLKEDLMLKDQRDRLLRKIDTADDDKKKELINDLEKVISKRFDLILERKKIEYQQMRKRLERLEKRIQKSQAKFEKWQSPQFKSQNVKARVEELASKAEKFIWE